MLSNPELKKRLVKNYYFTNNIHDKIVTVQEGQSYRNLTPLICIGEVQKSGAKVYFCPSNNDFCTIHDGQVHHFQTANEAYKSQDW